VCPPLEVDWVDFLPRHPFNGSADDLQLRGLFGTLEDLQVLRGFVISVGYVDRLL
tara:strand:- start:231 stop:395 length:165 start_codon:yes stop_codon:yes gene_type:complete